MFQPKKKVVMAQEVAQDIKNAIIKRTIKPGEKLNETQIAKLMGISRSPVRDALQQLGKEGVVVNIPYKGTFVNILGVKDVEDMYELRAVLESYALEKVIKSNNKKLIKILRLIVDEIEEAISQKNLEKLSKKDVEFHRRICHFTNNKKLIEIWEGFQTQFEILISLESSFYERLQLLADEHEELLSLIVKGKIREAQEKDKAHIIQAFEFLKKSMK
jgi:GntR family transcriptional regulator, gluconate operon transcriptional repressor